MIAKRLPIKWFGLLVITATTLWIAGCGPVKPPDVTDISVEPGTDILAGETASLTVEATGTNLQFNWTALKGKLSPQTAPAVIYTAPDTPGPDTVSVEVTSDGVSTIRTITFNVSVPTSTDIVTPTLTPTSTPTPTSTATLTLTPTATLTPPPTTEAPMPVPAPDAIIVGYVNLRSGPGTVYDIITTLSPSQVLTVTGRNKDATWLQVNTDQMQEGWVINRADLVTMNLPTERIPIVSTPPPPTVTAMPTQVSFQNFEPDNGTPPGGGNYFWDAWFTTCSFESAVVHEGSRAVRVDAHAAANGNPGDQGGTMGINPSSSEPIDLSSATTLSVWVYDTQGNNTVELKLRDYNDALSNAVWSEMHAEQNQWTEITWSLSDFAGVDLSQIKNIELYEWWDGVYYFDAVSWQ